MKNKNNESGLDSKLESINTPEQSNASEGRRKAVRNILAGSGLTVGAATSGQWVKPVVDSIVLPAHAQTSTTTVLAGTVNLVPVVMQPKQENSNSMLDFFIGPAHAGAIAMSEPDLGGSCVTLTITGSTFDVLIEFYSGSPIMFSGTISGGMISGSGSGVTVTGTADLSSATPTATGTISNAAGMYGYALSSGVTSCTPMAPATTAAPSTTVAPTTTMSATTTMMPYPTKPPLTTMSATTTMMPYPTKPPLTTMPTTTTMVPGTTLPPHPTRPPLTTVPPRFTTLPPPPTTTSSPHSS